MAGTNATFRRASGTAAATSKRDRGTGRCLMEAMEGREMYSVTDLVIDPFQPTAPATTTTTLSAEGQTSEAASGRRRLAVLISNLPAVRR